MKEGLVDIRISNVHSCAIEYIVDLIEKDIRENNENSIRGYHLFQEVLTFKNLLKQELHDIYDASEGEDSGVSFAVVNSKEQLESLIKELRDN